MARAATTPWTDEKVRELRQLWADGLSGTDIAKRLGDGFSRCAVLGKVFRLNLPLRVDSPNGHRGKAQIKPRKPRPMTLDKQQPEPPKPLPPGPPPAPQMRRRSFLTLKDQHCRWPLWPEEPGQLYCAADALTGKPYCAAHWEVSRVRSRLR